VIEGTKFYGFRGNPPHFPPFLKGDGEIPLISPFLKGDGEIPLISPFFKGG